MDNKKRKATKQGNVFIPIGIIVLVIIFATIFLVYCQVNIIIDNIRHDLFYASNNAILSFDLQDLAHKKYTVDVNQTKDIIEYILNKNYTEADGGITKIEITDLKVVNSRQKVTLKIQVQVTFDSVINIAGKREHSFKMIEEVGISLMEYK